MAPNVDLTIKNLTQPSTIVLVLLLVIIFVHLMCKAVKCLLHIRCQKKLIFCNTGVLWLSKCAKMRLPTIFIWFSFVLYGDDVARFGNDLPWALILQAFNRIARTCALSNQVSECTKNAVFLDRKLKNSWGGGTAPPQLERGTPPPKPHPLGSGQIVGNVGERRSPSVFGWGTPFH